jgi:hypothetical protein
MPIFLSQAEESKQSFERIEACLNQILDILKEEECQSQSMADPKGHYMDDECTYYHEQAAILRSEEVVENQVEDMKEEQTEDP